MQSNTHGNKMVQSFDGTMLYSESVGTGLPIVFCDGLGCDGFIWRFVREALAEHYQLIFWHYRGHGRSEPPRHPEAIGIGALCGDLRAVIDAYKLERAVLVGHSLGVQVILEAALAVPDKVAGLALICGGFGRPLDTLHDHGALGVVFPLIESALLRFPMAGQRLWRRLMMSRLANAYARRFEVNGRVVSARDFQPYFDHLVTMDTKLFVRLLSRMQAHDLEDRLHLIRQPALIIAGERDTFTPVRLSRTMRDKLGCADLLVVPGGTHIAPLESPDLVRLRLERFLADVARGGGP